MHGVRALPDDDVMAEALLSGARQEGKGLLVACIRGDLCEVVVRGRLR